MMSARKVMVVVDNRNEVVKVASLVTLLAQSNVFQPRIVVTGQEHNDRKQLAEPSAITPDHDLALMKPEQTLNELSSLLLERLEEVFIEEQPAVVVVQGDTATAAIGALAAFYRQIPVVHLEGGLRSGSLESPFPEEVNRRVAAQVAALHLAPTEAARDNLLREGFEPAQICVTGNLHENDHAAVRSVAAIAELLGVGQRVPDAGLGV